MQQPIPVIDESSEKEGRPFLFWWLRIGAPIVTLTVLSVYWLASLMWDYVVTPTRHFHEVAVMVPLLSITTFAIASVAQLFAYIIVACWAIALLRKYGRVSLAMLLATTPLLGFLTWFGYDYLVPDFRWYTDERPPYVHGLTLERFLYAWGFETLIIFGYWWPMRTYRVSAKAAT